MNIVYLVACAKEKAGASARAADLYQSDWFRKARAYVETRPAMMSGTGRWFILSAEYGLLDPRTIVEPYERSLHDMTAGQRRAWGDLVAYQLRTIVPSRCTTVFLAGALYRDRLMSWGSGRVVVPMAGLGIGQQKQWLAKHTTEGAA